MLRPSIFGEDLFDDFFGEFPFFNDRDQRKMEKKLYGHRAQNLMKTDIKENDQGYELMIDLNICLHQVLRRQILRKMIRDMN